MRIPDNLLNDEGKRMAQRSGRGIFSLWIGAVLSYIGLLFYLKFAPRPNLTLIEIWFALPGIVVPLGITLINRRLDRTLPLLRVSEDAHDRTTEPI